jgi:hypothetical protein
MSTTATSASGNVTATWPSSEMSIPQSDIVEEARRLLGAADQQRLTLRLLGGLAVALHSGPRRHPAFAREFKDIDFVARLKQAREIEAFFVGMGYESDATFNALNAGRRGMYHDDVNQRHIDVFIDRFEMCHTIPIAERLDVDEATIPLAELLLTKLQIVEVNEKDQRDICALIYEHDVADWGLWRTCRLNVEKLRDAIDRFDLSPQDRDVINGRLDELWERIEQEPKSRKWRLRDRVGDRRQWYLQPEEVDHG